MHSLKPIFWHQGLFLKPHHFQYLQAYEEENNSVAKQNSTPYFWGVSKLIIDEKELFDKNFAIEALQMVFLDGTTVDLNKDAIVSTRSFAKRYSDNTKALQLYIGLKKFDKNRVNVTEVDAYESLISIDTRFVSKRETTAVNNLYHKDDPAQVQFMDYYLKIFFEDEIADLHDYELLPLVKIVEENGQMVLDRHSTAPLLHIEADTNFFELIKTMQKNLTQHAYQLEEYKLSPSKLLQEPDYLKYFMALQSLSQVIPTLNHMLKTPHIHPWHYYGHFAQAIGMLSNFSTRINLLGKLDNGSYLLKEYEHNNLYECFDAMKILIGELLDDIIIGPDFVLPFSREDTSFSLECDVTIFQARYQYYLVIKAPDTSDDLSNNFSHFAKISSRGKIDTIVQRSLPGLLCERYDLPLQGFPQEEGNYYFKINTDDKNWIDIQQSQTIVIAWEDAPTDTLIELVVLKR